MLPKLLAGALFADVVALLALAAGPAPGQIKNLVTFGDSYTDIVGRLGFRPGGRATADARMCRSSTGRTRRWWDSMACLRRTRRQLGALPLR